MYYRDHGEENGNNYIMIGYIHIYYRDNGRESGNLGCSGGAESKVWLATVYESQASN